MRIRGRPVKKRKAKKQRPKKRDTSKRDTSKRDTSKAKKAPARSYAPSPRALATPVAPAVAVTAAVSASPVPRATVATPPVVTATDAPTSSRYLTLGAAVVAVVAITALVIRSRATSAPIAAPSLSGVPSASSASSPSAPVAVPAPPPSGPRQGTPSSQGPGHFADRLDVSVFQKGNIHTHTNLSDGDHPPEEVYAWYRDRGYAFLAITDHNTLTNPARFQPLERKNRFIMITGEEVTMRGAGKQVHVNALCTTKTIGGRSFDTQGQALAWGVQQITAQGGVALVNHPNWDWALTAEDVPAARGAALLEIASGHPYVHTAGDATHLSHEAIWDAALTAGENFAGAAVDDAHIYGPRAPETAARPGRAWIQVFGAELSRAAICDQLAKGHLYASTGVTLKRIVIEGTRYAVYPADLASEVVFIGAGGRVLQTGKAGPDGAASYTLKGDEGYVRARVSTEGDHHAWTEPSRVVRDL